MQRIINPLAGIPKHALFEQVEAYAAQNKLNDIIPLLKKGALAAQSPDNYENIEELDPQDVQVLREEVTHRWKHPWTLYYLVGLNSIGAAIQGWDQTGSNGANLSFPQAMGIPDVGPICEAAGNCESNSWLIGLINSMPYMTIALL